MLLFERDVLVVALTLGIAAAFYTASFNDPVAAHLAVDGSEFRTPSLQWHFATPNPARASRRQG
jgi:hypothetical protein